MPTCAFVSFRFGPTDGVSVVARTWMDAFEHFGFRVVTVAGAGDAAVVIDGLAIEPTAIISQRDLDGAVAEALADVDLAVVENLATLPLNIPAARAVGRALAGRPAILHHHDPPWQRPAFVDVTDFPLTDPAWEHVTINRITAAEMAARGFATTVIYNGFEPDHTGRRDETRRRLDVAPDELLLVHPVRAIARKNIPAAIDMAEAVGAIYWLSGPAEEDYGSELDRLLAAAGCRVIHQPARRADLYAASDAVLFPSTWEGFGNPPIEAALARRPCVVGAYPFAGELRALGFAFVDPDDVAGMAARLARPDTGELDRNASLAREHFSLERMRRSLLELLERSGWRP